MSIITHRYLDRSAEMGVWRIEEPEEWFRNNLQLHPLEVRQLEIIKGNRRVEWLAARHLVHLMSGRYQRAPFYKDQFGKPHLRGSDFHISISHSGGMSAAIAAPFLVGIDIQHIDEKIEKIAERFLSNKEQDSFSSSNYLEHLHVLWGAKEALYKLYGRRQLNFSSNIEVQAFDFDPQGGKLLGKIEKGTFKAYYELQYEMLENNILVYGWEK